MPRGTGRAPRARGERSGARRESGVRRQARAGGRLSAMRTVIVSGDALTVGDVVDVAIGEARAELAPDVPARMMASLRVVTTAITGTTPVYGVNTGFGALADTKVGAKDL